MTRRLISVAVAAAFTLTVLPIPMPVAVPSRSEKDTSLPFPCQNRTCGCCSADQCWKKCCCFTNSQKVSWAEENKVTLPQFVVDAAKKENADTTAEEMLAGVSREQLETEICSLPHATNDAVGEQPKSVSKWVSSLLGLNHQLTVEHVCRTVSGQMAQFCRLAESQVAQGDREIVDERNEADLRFVLIVKALECRGQGSQWIVCAPVAMQAAVSVSCAAEMPAVFVATVSERLGVGSLQPPVPPPRIG